MTDLARELEKIKPTTKRTQQIAFIFAFLALLVDGADMLLLSFSLNSLKAEFGLSNLQAGALGSFTLAGMAIGGFIGGWACDRLGRVRTVVISILVFSILTAALGFAQNFEQFAVLRFLSAFGIGSLYIAANTLMAEYVPTEYRTTVLGTLGDKNKGFVQVMQGFDFSRALIGLQVLAVARVSLDEAWEYAAQREAFGQPLTAFQGVSHPLAEYETQVEAARLLCLQTLWLKDNHLSHTSEAGMCKWWGPKLAYDVCNSSMSVDLWPCRLRSRCDGTADA